MLAESNVAGEWGAIKRSPENDFQAQSVCPTCFGEQTLSGLAAQVRRRLARGRRRMMVVGKP